ncbi:MAG: PHP domain-containing protein [Dehalococcoidia bacterium]|nr:PHP domain-containing protein [Dehalococcoidia bacterium]
MNIDLHIHTTASDGRFSPTEIVARAAELGMTAIAITDHDSVEGIAMALEEARKFPGLLVIPGVEMGADVSPDEMHILGYFIDHHSAELSTKLNLLRDSRTSRGKQMLSKLDALGIRVPWEYVAKIAGEASIGRPHIAQALVEYGHVSSINEAFERYIDDGGPAFVEREKLSPVETIELITKTGGLAVLAHPAKMMGLDTIIPNLKKAGLIGMEVYYKDYTSETIARLREVARRYGLIPCGGSDYHGFEGDGTRIGQTDVPQKTIDQLVALRKQRLAGKTP